MDSILTSIKKMLGVTEEYEIFDSDIIIHINSVFTILTQLGIGPQDGFAITDKNACWSDFVEDDNKLNDIKSYMYLKVKLLFDPSQSSIVNESMKYMISELEWRLNVAGETQE